MKQQRIYYAHSKSIYGTDQEQSELKWLRKRYSEVTDPNTDLGELGEMEPYLWSVGQHDAVVCSEYQDCIGKGVFHEVQKALGLKKDVWCLKKRMGMFYLRSVRAAKLFDTYDSKVRYAKLIFK